MNIEVGKKYIIRSIPTHSSGYLRCHEYIGTVVTVLKDNRLSAGTLVMLMHDGTQKEWYTPEMEEIEPPDPRSEIEKAWGDYLDQIEDDEGVMTVQEEKEFLDLAGGRLKDAFEAGYRAALERKGGA